MQHNRQERAQKRFRKGRGFFFFCTCSSPRSRINSFVRLDWRDETGFGLNCVLFFCLFLSCRKLRGSTCCCAKYYPSTRRPAEFQRTSLNPGESFRQLHVSQVLRSVRLPRVSHVVVHSVKYVSILLLSTPNVPIMPSKKFF